MTRLRSLPLFSFDIEMWRRLLGSIVAVNRWKLTKQLSKSFSAGSVVALLTIAYAMAANPNDVILFNAIQPTGIASNLTDTWYIYGAGTIDQHAAVRLKALVASKKIPQGSLLFPNSLGGDLLGGMALGREIRASGLLTYVNGANGMTNMGRLQVSPLSALVRALSPSWVAAFGTSTRNLFLPYTGFISEKKEPMTLTPLRS